LRAPQENVPSGTYIMFLDALLTLAHATAATTNLLGGKNAI
jgi:hypothetical protein